VKPFAAQFIPRVTPFLAASGAMAISALVLIGWAFHLPEVRGVFSDSATLKVSTAVGTLLCGVALAALSRQTCGKKTRRWIAGWGLAAVLLSGFSLGQDVFGWKIEIDYWLLHRIAGMARAVAAGRMSPASAYSLMLVGTALFLASRDNCKGSRLAAISALGSVVIIIGGMSVVGYALAALLHLRKLNYAGMAVHTGVSFVLLGSGLLTLFRKAEGRPEWSLDIVVTSGFLIGVLSLVGAAGESYSYTHQLVEASGWVGHTQEVLKEIQNIESDIASLGSSQRNYVNTGDQQSLDLYVQAKSGFEASVSALKKLTVDNPEQQRRLGELETLIAKRVGVGEQIISARRERGLSAAEQIIVSGAGTAASADLRRMIKEMQEEEYALLDRRQKHQDAVTATTFLLLPLGVFLSLTILALGLFFLNAGLAERKSLESANGLLAAIVASSDDAIIGQTLAGSITSWNSGAEKVFGFLESEMLGQSILQLFPSDRRQEEPDILARIRRGESVKTLDTIRRRKDGSAVHVAVTVSAIRNLKGEIVGASKVARDISERRLAETRINQLNNDLERRVAERTVQLEEANRELEAFSYSVSHDLRAPLRAVDGFSQAVLEDFGPQMPPDGRRQLHVIRESAQRMAELIDDLLTFSRLSRQPLAKQAVDTGNLVEGILVDLGAQTEGRQPQIRVGELPPCDADPALLRQVWVNLISNALKYSRKREQAQVEIGSARIKEEQAFFVRDNGCGFDMRYASKLFGVFQRLHRAEDYEGTGVGLAIVQRIVSRHGGRVWAEAAVDQGATFYFTLKGVTHL
jgi:PAS domain S-box-containing protein